MPDKFSAMSQSLTSPAGGAAAVTPHNTNELAIWSRGLYIGVSGDVAVTTVNGDEVTFVGLAAGIIHPIRAKVVKSTGTTATSILAVY